jgi:hypothetical protein
MWLHLLVYNDAYRDIKTFHTVDLSRMWIWKGNFQQSLITYYKRYLRTSCQFRKSSHPK